MQCPFGNTTRSRCKLATARKTHGTCSTSCNTKAVSGRDFWKSARHNVTLSNWLYLASASMQAGDKLFGFPFEPETWWHRKGHGIVIMCHEGSVPFKHPRLINSLTVRFNGVALISVTLTSGFICPKREPQSLFTIRRRGIAHSDWMHVSKSQSLI